MDKQDFKALLNTYFIPIFTGSSLLDEELESNSRESVCSSKNSNKIVVKPEKIDTYRLIIKRAQPFSSEEIRLAQTVFNELMYVSLNENIVKDYLAVLQEQSVERAICSFLSIESSKIIIKVIDYLTDCASKTYEGRRISFGFIVTNIEVENTSDNILFDKFNDKDFLALLSDGVCSNIILDKNGYLIGVEKAKQLNQDQPNNIKCPFRFTDSAYSCDGEKIGINLLSNGEILIFKNKELLFAKRRGKWKYFNHESNITKIAASSRYTNADINLSIYLSSLDVSFARTGGCIAYLRQEHEKHVLKHINSSDILIDRFFYEKNRNPHESLLGITLRQPFSAWISDKQNVKAACLYKIIGGRKFQDLDRKLRQELLGIDGATIIDHEGNIIAVGAIIKIESGSEGGARLKATKELAKYGPAIKISADGEVRGYHIDNNEQGDEKIKLIFSIG